MNRGNQTRFIGSYGSLMMAIVLCIGAANARATGQDVSDRSLIIAVSSDAPPQIQAAAETIRSAATQQPLLKMMAGNHEVRKMDSAALLGGPYRDRALNHIVVIGLPSDPVVAAVWQREAAIESGGIFVFGFGHFKGDIGYIESDRNPFLHGANVDRAPYEAEIVTISGTTPAGVVMAAHAFVDRDVVNGVIASTRGWSRPFTSLLDRDPITPDVKFPAVPSQLKDAQLIGVTQASGDEYCNVLADTGFEPIAIWRFKYYLKGAWDAPGVDAAIAEYNAGLHRRALADTLWVGVFAAPEEAASAAAKIAAAIGSTKTSRDDWSGNGKDGDGKPIAIWINGSTVYMSDLRR